MIETELTKCNNDTLRSIPTSARRTRRSGPRLQFEALEERCVLSSFANLDPGGPVNLAEQVPVNFVFVGYEAGQVDESAFRAALPTRSDPIIRSRAFYGVREEVGLHYTYDYKVTFTDAAYEDALFGALRQLGVQRPAPTLFQQLYNSQIHNVLDVTHNYFIDAPSVEKWLAANAPAGVDTRQDTVFFINWWGRDDFVFHTYSKYGEPDPDTGIDPFATYYEGYSLNSWGGTTADDEESGLGDLGTHRIWFNDLSAGPIAGDYGWNLDDRDLDGDGRADYRIPPVWEYLTPGGYRAATALTGDLARLARYVAIDLYFTPSPLYPPYLTPDRMPDEINLDVNVYEGIDGLDASEKYIDINYLRDEVSELYRIPFTADEQDLALEGEAKECWEGFVYGDICHEEEGNASSWANLFYDAALNLDDLLDGPASTTDHYVYEAVAVTYFDEAVADFQSLGWADDNWRNGTQSFVFMTVLPEYMDAIGDGITTTLIHEYGHHFGLSHVHDGYDPRAGHLSPTGNFFFLWAGNQVNSAMSYYFINYDFSQFDRDNANRWLAAAYIRSANNIAERVLTEGNAKPAVGVLLNVADAKIGKAAEALHKHDYLATFDHAQAAYKAVLQAAKLAGVEVLPVDDGRSLGGQNSTAETVATHAHAVWDPVTMAGVDWTSMVNFPIADPALPGVSVLEVTTKFLRIPAEWTSAGDGVTNIGGNQWRADRFTSPVYLCGANWFTGLSERGRSFATLEQTGADDITELDEIMIGSINKGL